MIIIILSLVKLKLATLKLEPEIINGHVKPKGLESD